MRLRELLNEAVNPGDAIDGLVNKIVAYPGRVKGNQVKAMHDWGKPMQMLFKLLDIYIATEGLYSKLDALDQLYNTKQVDRNQLETKREEYFSTFTAQILLPMIVRKIANSRIVLWIARILIMLIGVGGSVVTMGATLAAAIGTEVFLTWLTNWLGSSEGQNWLAGTFFMGIIRGAGKIEDSVWSSLTGYYEKKEPKTSEPATEKPGTTQKAPGDVTTPAPVGAEPEPDANSNPLSDPLHWKKTEPIYKLH